MSYRGKPKGSHGNQPRHANKSFGAKRKKVASDYTGDYVSNKVKEIYPYLGKSEKEKTIYDKLATVLYSGDEQNDIVLTAETAKKNLDGTVGYDAEEMGKKYVVLHEDSGGYEWYGFNDGSDWLLLNGSNSLSEQVSENDAQYLLRFGKRVSV